MVELIKYAGNNKKNISSATSGSIGYNLPGNMGKLKSGESYKVGSIPADSLITRVTIVTTTAFNGTTPTIDIGDSANENRFGNDIDISQVGLDSGTANIYVDAPTDVVIKPTISGCTAGDCKVVIEFVETAAYTASFTG